MISFIARMTHSASAHADESKPSNRYDEESEHKSETPLLPPAPAPSPSMWDLPVHGADAALFAVLQDYATRLLHELPTDEPSLVTQLKAQMRGELRGGDPSVGKLARRMGIGERTLQLMDLDDPLRLAITKLKGRRRAYGPAAPDERQSEDGNGQVRLAVRIGGHFAGGRVSPEASGARRNVPASGGSVQICGDRIDLSRDESLRLRDSTRRTPQSGRVGQYPGAGRLTLQHQHDPG